MSDMSLDYIKRLGVTLLGDDQSSGGVTLAFTTRNGGLSQPPYTGLNLGLNTGDDPEVVWSNRWLLLEALGLEAYASRLIAPVQTHGTHLVTITKNDEASVARAQTEAEGGADGVICTALQVPVLLCFADCVPVILVARDEAGQVQGFAVVHSGWRGTFGEIAKLAAEKLCQVASVSPSAIQVFIGPHIQGGDYEVAPELMDKFHAKFGNIVSQDANYLDMSRIIVASLEDAQVLPENIWVSDISTYRATDMFYSYRFEGGICGRHGAIACLM